MGESVVMEIILPLLLPSASSWSIFTRIFVEEQLIFISHLLACLYCEGSEEALGVDEMEVGKMRGWWSVWRMWIEVNASVDFISSCSLFTRLLLELNQSNKCIFQETYMYYT